MEAAKTEAGGNCAVSKRYEKPAYCDPVPVVSSCGQSWAQMFWAEKGQLSVPCPAPRPCREESMRCCMTIVLLGKAGWRPGKRWVLQVSFSSAEAPLLSSVSRHGGGALGGRWKSLQPKEMKPSSLLFPARGCFCCYSFPPLLSPVSWMHYSGTCRTPKWLDLVFRVPE